MVKLKEIIDRHDEVKTSAPIEIDLKGYTLKDLAIDIAIILGIPAIPLFLIFLSIKKVI